jgi:transketolase
MSATAMMTMRESYGKTLARLGEKYKNIVVLDADISKSTCTYYFGKKFPERWFNFGVAEQNMMSVAAGLATCGKIPFVNTYAVFASMRACEQIRTMIAYPCLNVKIVASHGGIATGWDGVTHQGTEDIAIVRSIPNVTVVSPADPVATAKLVEASVRHKGPMYIRLARNPCPIIYRNDEKFTLGKAKVLKEGSDVTIIATGVMVFEALKAEEILRKKGVSVRVVDIHTIKPIDEEVIIDSARRTNAVLTAEDHNILGGLGGAVAEVLCRNYPVPMEFIGLRDTFGESGSPKELFEKYGLSHKHIVRKTLKLLRRKR